MKQILGDGRFANVTAILALVVALGGTAYAANTIRSPDIVNGQVKSLDIGKGQVKSIDLAKNAVTSPKVKDGSLRKSDFRAGELPAGPAGPAGAAGATNVAVVRAEFPLASGSSNGGTAACPSGTRATGGGVGALVESDLSAVVNSSPLTAAGTRPATGEVAAAWAGRFFNGSLDPTTGYVYVICAAP